MIYTNDIQIVGIENIKVIVEEDSNRKQLKQQFIEKILAQNKKETHFNILTEVEYNKLIVEVKAAKVAVQKSRMQYRRLNRFDIIKVGDEEKLIAKQNGNDAGIRYYLKIDEVYDAIEKAHVAIRHGGRDKLRQETSIRYANITVEMVSVFLALCQVCQLKKLKKSLHSTETNFNVKQTIHTELLNSRCQVEIIDMQSRELDGKKYILLYQDNLTKFIQLRALLTKSIQEVSVNLLNIFLTFGAPCFLQSNIGIEFCKDIINELRNLWPDLKVVCGKTLNNQHKSSTELECNEMKNILISWLTENNSSDWPNRLPFVQFFKNTTLYNLNSKQISSYELMFGTKPRNGLKTYECSLPNNIINSNHMYTEDEIEIILNDLQTENKTDVEAKSDKKTIVNNLQTINQVDEKINDKIQHTKPIRKRGASHLKSSKIIEIINETELLNTGDTSCCSADDPN